VTAPVPTHVRCTSCGLLLLAFKSLGAKPVGHDDCPNCGKTEFAFQ
jgi:hypothetical protein